ncbi:next to BRCA1 gene 1 protein [Eudromia elegans]
MEPHVDLRVSCRGETRSFLVSDSLRTTWADVEAMVKISFDLNNIQIKYFDEDNDEVSVNSKEEYEEALKIAVKQGNQLQMNVYEGKPSPEGRSCPLQLCENAVSEKLPVLKEKRKSLPHNSTIAPGLEEDAKNEKMTTNQQKLNRNRKGRKNENPPEWFTSYLETFREQVVKETVEKLEQKLYEKLLHHNQPPDFSESSATAATPTSEPQSGNEDQCDWLISCCNCQVRIVGVRYQCSLCPAYNICEQCEAGTYTHDPNHILLKLRRPIPCVTENYGLAQVSPHLPATLEQVRLQKQMDKRFLKAEKQRLRAEKKQRKAEVRELKKQLKLHRKIHLWNSVNVLETSVSPLLKTDGLQPFLSSQPFQAVVPTLSAIFVDENLPDGTRLQPGTKFIKHWRMKNTGNVEWSSDTKLKLMWGNLTLASSEKKDVLVPSLPSGQVGTVSVEFVAPNIEGIYTSHWRLSHRGEQFGPRIWCSIVVDPSPATVCVENNCKDSDSCQKDKASSDEQNASLRTEAGAQLVGDLVEQAEIPLPNIPLKTRNLPNEREFYIPSVDLLTAQDLLSFELLDINIVQELERVPHNTPVDMTPCMSPLPHDNPLLEKPGLGQIEEENEGSGFKPLPGLTEACFTDDACMVKVRAEQTSNQEEGEEDMSGTQFVCETVIRSLTLDAAPDHKPPQRKSVQNSLQILDNTFSCDVINEEFPRIKTNYTSKKDIKEVRVRYLEATRENECEELQLSDKKASTCSETGSYDDDDATDDVQSQGSSVSSEDYIIILPECFDTSRPLGESMYSSALSQPSLEKTGEPQTKAEIPKGGSQPQIHSVSDPLTASETLAEVPPETADTAQHIHMNLTFPENHVFQEPNTAGSEDVSSTPMDQIREEPRGEDSHGPGSSKPRCSEYSRHPQGSSIAGGLVKGALSVAASAYKALFAGPPITEQQPTVTEEHTATLLSSLCEMGFCDRQLNLQLLKKHNNNMVQVVTELLQINNSDWYSDRC